jgi:flagellar protein FlaG
MAAPPKINLVNSNDFRESYANSVQVRWSVWDFFLVFGTFQSQTEEAVEIKNFQGTYLSPQQAKALLMIMQENVANYEKAFGEIKLDSQFALNGPVN